MRASKATCSHREQKMTSGDAGTTVADDALDRRVAKDLRVSRAYRRRIDQLSGFVDLCLPVEIQCAWDVPSERIDLRCPN